MGPYKVLRHIGSGGMGAVWLAEDTRLRRWVALKMVRAADTAVDEPRSRLMREARAAAALNHPHIAAVHDVIETDGDVVIVFEFVEGETLHSVLRRGPLPPATAVDLAIQIAKALAHAHRHGIVHRDLKPANVIVGAGGDVKVLDFGIARMLAIGTTETVGSVSAADGVGFIGTASYAAPEQMVSSAVDERADLYALGVMLFEMLSGSRPFPGNDPVQLARTKLSQDPPPLKSTGTAMPAALERLVSSLLQRQPDHRPSSATEVVARLTEIFGTSSTGTLMPTARGTFWLSAAAVAIIAALAGFGAWELNRFVRPAERDPSAAPVIAVLPLTNVSGDPSRDHVAAGIAESLISSLASLPSVTVLSRSSVTEARARTQDEAALARDLGAAYIVNGSVQEANGSLKISLNLVTPNRMVAWGDSVEGAFDQIFALQARLSTALTNALVVRVSAVDRARINAQPTGSPDALSAYWRGQALLERRDVKGNLDAAIASFSEAIRIDQQFALAHAALGAAYWAKYLETLAPDLPEKAMDAGTTALRIDPDQPEVRYTLAVTLAGRGRSSEAIDELHRALAMRPNYEDARRQLGLVLGRLGRVDESVAEYRKALALRPNSASTYSSMGLVLYGASRYDEAIAAFKRATELQPDNFMGFQQLGTAYHAVGQTELALENYQRATEIRPSPSALSNMGTLHHSRGEFSKAVDAYRQAIALRPNSAATHRNLGDSLSRLGHRAEARAAYLKAASLSEADLKVNPNDPRIMAMLAVNLQKAGQSRAAQLRIIDALKRAPSDVEVLYRAAVIHALDGRTKDALPLLARALEGGYSRSRAGEDDDFAELRGMPEFDRLVGVSRR